MIKRKLNAVKKPLALFEALETRRLLSVSLAGHHHHSHKASSGLHHALHHSKSPAKSDGTSGSGGTSSNGYSLTTMDALQNNDSAAYAELNSQASADSVTLAGTQSVYVHTINSTTTDYIVELHTASGRLRFVSDENGSPVANPTPTPPSPPAKPTFGSLTDTAATAEITALAAALNLTAPSASDNICVHVEDGLTTYTDLLALAGGTGHSVAVTVDAAGNPAGEMVIPFSTLNSTISGGLDTLATADSQTIAGTQNVRVITSHGVTTYSAMLTAPGQITILTVDNTGAPATLTFGEMLTSGAGDQ